MASEFAATFFRDAEYLLRETSDFLSLQHALHSLKSGAAFLGWTELEDEAHRLEEVLNLSKGQELPWEEISENLRTMIMFRETEMAGKTQQKSSAGHVVVFSQLENRILEESRRRNESFYRLTCRIDPSEPLPYPRAFLILSKLETNMNLVKSDPPMDDPEGNFAQCSFWFTTDKPESEIFKLTNIDLVEVVELVYLDYKDALRDGAVNTEDLSDPVKAKDSYLSVEAGQFNGIVEIAEELAWRLERQPGTPEATLSVELQKSLETLVFRPIEPMLEDIAQGSSRLAKRQNLNVLFQWSAASEKLDTETLETLSEILKQLVRNSLRHGIEGTEERRLAGKKEVGLLSLQVEHRESSLYFRFEDDGRGIDEEGVLRKARQDGLIQDGDSVDIVDLLCSPGFTTVENADVHAGRGIGLDMIQSMIRRKFGRELEMDNRPGIGLAWSWLIPEESMRRVFVVFVFDGTRWAIPADAVRRRSAVDTSKIAASGQFYSFGGGRVPIVGPLGICPPGTLKPYVLEINHRGRRAALFVDDLVSEKPWGAGDMVPADPVGQWGRALKDAKEGIPILSPAVVYAAEEGVTASGVSRNL